MGDLKFILSLVIIWFNTSISAQNRFIADPADWLMEMNNDLAIMNKESSEITWANLIGEQNISDISLELAERSNRWRNAKCNEASENIKRWQLSAKEARMIWLLCRGPKYTPHQARLLNNLLRALSIIYNDSQLCRWENTCYSIEPDLTTLMKTTRDPAQLLWAWHGWRSSTGQITYQIYPSLITLQNQAAQNNGYTDMGECWREELEIENLESLVEKLYKEIAPFHKLLHAYVRYHLNMFYGESNVGKMGQIPAHLLGNMWSQSWENIQDLLPVVQIDFDSILRRNTNNINDLTKLAEDFYASLGFPKMSEKFWRYSQVTKKSNDSSCHGTAANMFNGDDFRMLLCAKISWEDLYIIHHEMGHIHYFNAYKKQPAIFKDGANSAFQEAIGDTIMISVESPKHLQRIGILQNEPNEDLKISLLLHQALKKIPQLPFGLVMDKWRWNVMASKITPENYNKYWWHYRTLYEGIKPPVPRGKYDFDAASKFHIDDNTPYIRYYLSEFLQFQLFEELCTITFEDKPLQDWKLSECDLYGSSKAGEKLRNLMSEGSSRPWYELLAELTSHKKKVQISSRSMLKYFTPLIEWLEYQIKKHDIPIGW
ncbi:angiotensin-converting enzyme-like [Rhodnius prolixus]|uniref:angiotensin-converting enzyme-like n=1 Tax=Rhodnius prolixus TaxID=13249 RepID=UPI003D18EB5F